jgi:hypothetical protein
VPRVATSSQAIPIRIADHVAGLAGQEADAGLEEAGGKRALFDPADVGGVDLGQDQRHEREPHHADAGYGGRDGPPA